MNFELAKELLIAGYPIRTRGMEVAPDGILDNWTIIQVPDVTSLPTLEELIEACGDKFESLCRLDEPDIGVWYRAYPTDEGYTGDCVKDCCGYEDGKTHTEAVARLWLALNKK